MRRILFVNLEGRTGGAEKSLLLLVRYLQSEFIVEVACPAQSELSMALAAMGINCRGLPRAPKGRYWSAWSLPYWFRVSCRVLRAVLKAKPDIIHANSLYAGAASVLAALVTGKRLIVHARDFNHRRFITRACTRLCEKVIAVSEAVRKSLKEQGVAPEKMEVVYNGVDEFCDGPGGSDRAAPDDRAKGDNHEFIFAQVGQFAPWKNHRVFLEAALRVAEVLPEARFVLVGDDIFGRDSGYKTGLLDYVSCSRIAERIDLTGWQENMNRVWARIGCLVHTAGREPFGRVVIEAMAHKVPVIAVAGSGPGEIIRSGNTGLLVRAGDIEALTEAMLHVAQDRQAAKKLAEAGYQHALSNFTAEKTAAKVAEIYEKVLAE
jgi:glycosyltransferase involved in cell wall biosynthesis